MFNCFCKICQFIACGVCRINLFWRLYLHNTECRFRSTIFELTIIIFFIFNFNCHTMVSWEQPTENEYFRERKTVVSLKSFRTGNGEEKTFNFKVRRSLKVNLNPNLQGYKSIHFFPVKIFEIPSINWINILNTKNESTHKTMFFTYNVTRTAG